MLWLLFHLSFASTGHTGLRGPGSRNAFQSAGNLRLCRPSFHIRHNSCCFFQTLHHFTVVQTKKTETSKSVAHYNCKESSATHLRLQIQNRIRAHCLEYQVEVYLPRASYQRNLLFVKSNLIITLRSIKFRPAMHDDCECESQTEDKSSELDGRIKNQDSSRHQCCNDGKIQAGITSENDTMRNTLVRPYGDFSGAKLDAEKSSLIISEGASRKMKEIRSKENSELSWRMTLVKTHCMRGRGYTYSISLETPSQSDYQLSHTGTIEVYAPLSDVSRLGGSELDYVEMLQQEGFVVKNPNAKSKCPCGRHDIFD